MRLYSIYSFTISSQNSLAKWFDLHTAKNIQCVISNIFLEKTVASLTCTSLLNLPLRVWNCAQGAREKNYWKITLDIAAFIVLYHPMGRKISIAIDCASEIINVYKKINASPPMSLEKALYKLGLSEEKAQDPSVLEKRYDEVCKFWDRRINRTKGTHPPLYERFKSIREQVDCAYNVIKREIPHREIKKKEESASVLDID